MSVLMSAIGGKADMTANVANVRQVPIVDIARFCQNRKSQRMRDFIGEGVGFDRF